MVNNIFTQHADRKITLQVAPIYKQDGMTLEDVARSVCITSYIESLLEDFDEVNKMRINNKIKQCVRRFLQQHDKGARAFLTEDATLQISNTLTKEMDRFRGDTKKELSKKSLDENHHLLFLTYELNAIHIGLSKLPYEQTLAYSNATRSLVNAINDYLLKIGFVDKLNIHTKRHKVLSILEGYTKEALVIFTDAQDMINEKLKERYTEENK